MTIQTILNNFKDGNLSMADAAHAIDTFNKFNKTYEDIGFAKIDHHRKTRTGYPEVIFGESKLPEHTAEIFQRLADVNNAVICTRASLDTANAVIQKVPPAKYDPISRLIILNREPVEKRGLVAVAAAGTSDIHIAEEAAQVLELFGSDVARLYDVGVAGVHRLLAQQDILKKANCVIAIAGMEGALPSVVSGLVAVPVIAVPTSVGYGANLGGFTPLLAMLCSCAAGVSVVNIDNGFGAAYQADMINKQAIR